MTTGIIIAAVVFGTFVLAILAFIAWMFSRAVLYKEFQPPQIDDKDFIRAECNGVPYLLDKGLPYKGVINSLTSHREPLNSGYKFSIHNKKCSPYGIRSGYKIVKLPYCYNKMGTNLENYRGDVWYERDFEIKKIENKPVIRLTFMGCFLTAEVYIDGKLIGKNGEGYLPFSFDISHLEEGKHKLVVKVNNETTDKTLPIKLFEGHRPGWHHYSGIHKEVYIEYLSKVSLFKLSCIPFLENKEWKVRTALLFERPDAESGLKFECSLFISDDSEQKIGEKKLSFNFEKDSKVAGGEFVLEAGKDIKPWSEKTPYLYKMNMISAYEQSYVKFGFREISWSDGKIFINGEHTFLKGICRHEDNGEKGLATDIKTAKREMELIKKARGNFARLAHYPHSVSTLDIADNLGLYVWAEVPFYQAGHAITHDTFGKEFGYVKINLNILRFIENIKKTSLVADRTLLKKAAQSLIKMVERDVNHPSIITWSIGNELWSINKASEYVCKWLKDVVLSYDRSRAVNYASMSMPLLTKPCERSFKVMDWVCINEYYGWYYGSVKGKRGLAKGLYKRYPDKPMVITETGSDTLYGLRDERYPPKNKHSEDYQSYYLKETWKNLSLSPNFSGMAVWVFKDFPCPEYTHTNLVPFYNMKGLFDKDMNQKLGYQTLKNLFVEKDNQIK